MRTLLFVANTKTSQEKFGATEKVMKENELRATVWEEHSHYHILRIKGVPETGRDNPSEKLSLLVQFICEHDLHDDIEICHRVRTRAAHNLTASSKFSAP